MARNKKQKKRVVQIFVKVDGTKTVLREVSPEDKVQKILNDRSGSDQDVYAMCEGRMLRQDDAMTSCGVRDESTIQIMSRMRGGGKHKDKKSKEKHGKTLEQKFVEEVRSDEGPAIRECGKDATVTRQESMSDVSQETQERDEDKMIHLLDEDSMKSWVEYWSKESDNEVGQKMENWMSALQGLKKWIMNVQTSGSVE